MFPNEISLTSLSVWARGSGLEIALFVTGTILMTRLIKTSPPTPPAKTSPGQPGIPNRDILSLSPRSCELALPSHANSFSRRGIPWMKRNTRCHASPFPGRRTTRSERHSGPAGSMAAGHRTAR